QAKGSQAPPGSTDADQPKGSGQGDLTQQAPPPPGAAKEQTETAKGAPKELPQPGEMQTPAKGGEGGQNAANAKPAPPDMAQRAGEARPADRKGATLDDVNDLQRQQGDASGGDMARQGLERISKEASDPKVREAAREALEQRPPGTAKDAGPPTAKNTSQPEDKGQPKGEGQKTDSAASKDTQPDGQAGKSKDGNSSGGDNSPVAKGQQKKPGRGNPG